jgi:hypothetical protein
MQFHTMLASVAAIAAVATAQTTASYELYGTGCNGAVVSSCLSLNDVNPVLQVASLPNEYAYPVVNTTGAPIQIIGFEVFTQSNTGNVETGNTGILFDLAGPGATTHTQPAPTNSANGTITVGGTAGWYATTVYPPITIGAGVAFWFHVDAYSRIAPPQHSTTGGVAGPTRNWYRRPSNSMVWTSSVSVARQIFRIHCLPASPTVPSLLVDRAPVLGQQITFRIGGGMPNTAGFFMFGFDGSQWGGMPTPVDLQIIGAPNCLMWTSTDLSTTLPLDGSGTASFTLGVPSTPALSGARFYNQGAMIAPGTGSLGIVFSNAGRGVIGT